MRLAVLDPRTSPLYAAERDLRYRVLREPLGMGRHEVGFAGEEDALHVVAAEGVKTDARVLGCALFDFASGRLRAMAVDPALQRSGVGSALVARLEDEVRSRGVREVKLHARTPAVGFYARLGYAVDGASFTEVGIEHWAMKKRI
ncbi:MAG: GNAT family N-acetyltransferase [Polyangiaceae bacterium]